MAVRGAAGGRRGRGLRHDYVGHRERQSGNGDGPSERRPALTPSVTGSTATPTWAVNGVTGGNSTLGTISTAGLYTAPVTVPLLG